jgi:type IV pilus assembly protein PilW
MSARTRGMPSARQDGRTLIEVMVAIAIGMMLTLGVLSIYLANRQTYRASSDLQRIQSAGQLALDRVGFQVRSAGYVPLELETPLPGRAVMPCSGGFVDPTAAILDCQENDGLPDGLSVRYRVEAPVAGRADDRDCLGAEVPPDATGARILENRYYIAQSGGVPTLMCWGNGSPTPAPIIPNVEDFQIRLRVGEPFTRVEQVVSPHGYAAIDPDWSKVLALELCVLVVSEGTGLTTDQQAGRDCRGAAFPNDGRLRRVFNQVVTLRNRNL